jgi:hypothetical protein
MLGRSASVVAEATGEAEDNAARLRARPDDGVLRFERSSKQRLGRLALGFVQAPKRVVRALTGGDLLVEGE